MAAEIGRRKRGGWAQLLAAGLVLGLSPPTTLRVVPPPRLRRGGRSGVSVVQPEDVFGEAGDVHLQGEKAAGEAFAVGRAEAAAGGGDVERGEAEAAEGAGGDGSRRHLDDAVDAAIGGDANDAATAIARVPEVAGAVNRRAVGAAAVVPGKERPLVGDPACRAIVVPHRYDVGERIAEVEAGGVRAPAERVGYADACLLDRRGALAGDAEEAPQRAVGDRNVAAVVGDIILHGSGPEIACRI